MTDQTQNIEFYYDPSCPWCWVTSRWLNEVKKHRDMNVSWKPFSLALKNGELDGDDATGHSDTHSIGHGVLRMIEAINTDTDMDRGELYTQFGKAYFLEKELDDTVFMGVVLERLGLGKKYLQSAKDVSIDKVLQESLDSAIEVVGDDVGVPTIIFVNEDGERQGFFGPVLQGLPDMEEGLKLWDGLSNLASSSKFFELKRTRKGRSKIKSTKRLFDDLQA